MLLSVDALVDRLRILILSLIELPVRQELIQIGHNTSTNLYRTVGIFDRVMDLI